MKEITFNTAPDIRSPLWHLKQSKFLPAGWIVTHLGESKLSLFIPDPLWIRRTKEIHKHGTNGCASYGAINILWFFWCFYSFSVNLLVGDLEEVLQQNLDTEEKAISCSFHRKYHSNFIFPFPAFSHMYQASYIMCLTFEGNFLPPPVKAKIIHFIFLTDCIFWSSMGGPPTRAKDYGESTSWNAWTTTRRWNFGSFWALAPYV